MAEDLRGLPRQPLGAVSAGYSAEAGEERPWVAGYAEAVPGSRRTMLPEVQQLNATIGHHP